MKRLLSVLLVVLTLESFAAGHRIPRRRFRPHWKTITAVGVATGTTILAYKVGNGIEKSVVISAEKRPDAFDGWLDRLTAPLRFLLWAASLTGVLYLVPRIVSGIQKCKKQPSNKKKEP